jgi:hypothetical protein
MSGGVFTCLILSARVAHMIESPRPDRQPESIFISPDSTRFNTISDANPSSGLQFHIRNQSPLLQILGFLLPAINVGQPPPCHGTATALPTLAPDGRRCGPLSVACQRLSPVSELPPAELDREICSHLRMFQKRRHTAGWESSVGPVEPPASGQCLGVFCQPRGILCCPCPLCAGAASRTTSGEGRL